MTKLGDIMREGFLIAVQRTATVAEAARVMTRNNVGIVAVLDGDRLVGVCSERDVVRRVIVKALDAARTLVGEVMTRDLVVSGEDEGYREAIRKMNHANIRHLPVVREGRIVGIVSVRDLMRVDMERMGDEIKYLHEYLYTVPPGVGDTSA